MKRLLALLLLISTPVWAQSTASQTVPGTLSIVSGQAKWAPISSTNQLPIAVYDAGNHSGYVYTSNGSGSPATFQAGGGGSSGLSIGTTTITGGTNNYILYNNDGVLGNEQTVPVANGGTGTATSFTQGSVVFAGASGVYTQDNANLFWDATNHRLGIGSTTPAATLDVSGTVTATAIAIGSAVLTGNLTTNVTGGGTQCLHASNTGVVTGTGADCGAGGGGAVSSVSNADGTLIISPTTGSVIASLALGHANTWTAAQTINGAVNTSALNLTGNTDTASTKVLNIAETWNNASTTFDAPLFMNITNTASNAASKLADFQVGGVSKFGINTSGVVVSGSVGIGTTSPSALLQVNTGSTQNVLFGATATSQGAFLYNPSIYGTGESAEPGVFGLYDFTNNRYYGMSAALPSPSGWSTLGGYYKGLGIGGSTSSGTNPIFGVLNSAQGGSGIGNVAFTVYDTNKVVTYNNTLDNGSGAASFAGNVGIGTTSPSTALQVVGTVTATGATINGTSTATTFSGSGASLTGIGTASLGGITGSPSSTTFLAGNGTWAVPAGGGVSTFSAGTTGLTPNSATSGAVTLAGTLAVANGGTGNASLTKNGILIGAGTSTIGATVNTVISTNINADVATAGATPTTIVLTDAQTLSASLTIPANVFLRVAEGGSITKASSYTLTINGPFDAGRYKVFNGFNSGDVTFGEGYIQALDAEWWGGKPDNSTVDDTAFTSVFAAMTDNSGQYLSLAGGQYLLTSCAVQITKNGVGIIGVNFQSTGIACSKANADIIDLAGSGGTQYNGNFFRNFYIYRTVGSSAGYKGLSISYGINTLMENVLSMNSAEGFYFKGTGDLLCQTCITNYQLSTAISYYGFYIDGAAPNASLYIKGGAAAAPGVTLTNSYGAYLTGTNIEDTYINDLQTASMGYGVYINSAGTLDNDIHINDPIIDQFTTAGIYVTGAGGTGVVTIKGGWINPTPTATGKDIDLESSSGIVVTGGVQLMSLGNSDVSPNTGNTCVYMSGVTNSSITGNQMNGCIYAVNATGSSYNTITGNAIYNASAQTATTDLNFASTSVNNVVSANTLNGYATNGIVLDSSSRANFVQNNQINPAHVSTPCGGINDNNCNFAHTVSNSSAVALFESTGTNDSNVFLNAQNGSQNVNIAFLNGGTNYWDIGLASTNVFHLTDAVNSVDFLRAVAGGSLTLGNAQNFSIANSTGAVTIGTTGIGSSSLNVNGNVAIGTSYLTTAAPTNGMIVQGFVGIGTTAPNATLDVRGSVSVGSSTMLYSTTTLTNGSGASVGTLTNAPAVGNPTKWIPINDNGTTRYIPAW